MKVVLRVDASEKIGTGHFMRCLTLADTLLKRGAQCVFLSRDVPAHLQHLVQRQGHTLRHLPVHEACTCVGDLAHSSWLGTDQVSDAADCLAALQGQLHDWLIVDHYALDHRWETQLRQVAGRILVIDDLADRRHDCDLLLDQNLYQDMQTRYNGKVPQACGLLLGPKFALLREEFRLLREELPVKQGDIRRVLVFFGGVDEHDFTSQALEAIVSLGRVDLEVYVVLGAQHPRRSAIESLCKCCGYHFYVQTSRMAELMSECDFAVGATGTATWERASLGLPALVVSVAENQRKIAEGAHDAGLLTWIGNADSVSKDLWCKHIEFAFNSPEIIMMQRKACLESVDAEGVRRVLEAML